MTQHTPTPWELISAFNDNAPNSLILRQAKTWGAPSIVNFGHSHSGITAADAAFIVKAVNAHDKLISNLQSVISAAELSGIADSDPDWYTSAIAILAKVQS